MKKKIIISLVGYGRSGSTILSQILNSLDGCFAVGEVLGHQLNQAVEKNRVPCSCGEDRYNCMFWKNIISHNKKYSTVFFNKWLTIKLLPFFFIYKRNAAFKRDEQELIKNISELFLNIFENTECNVLIEGGKNARYSKYLERIPNVEVIYIHLVRDVMSVCESYSNNKEWLKKNNKLITVFKWLLYNKFAEQMKKHNRKYLLIKYEDFVDQPADIINQIILMIDSNIIDKNKRDFVLENNHLLGSNPNKFEKKIIIKKQPMKMRKKKELFSIFVNLVAGAKMKDYGY